MKTQDKTQSMVILYIMLHPDPPDRTSAWKIQLPDTEFYSQFAFLFAFVTTVAAGTPKRSGKTMPS